MNTPRSKKDKVEKYTLRLYDSYDGYWIDIHAAADVSYEEALKEWNEHTNHGTKFSKLSHGAYYDIFPSGTRMLFNGESV